MPSTMEGGRARWSRARMLTMGAAVVSVGSVVVAITLPVTALSWCLGALAGAAAMLAVGAARRGRETVEDLSRLEAEREALVVEQRRVRAVQAEALARLDSRPPPSSGPISTIPPSGPISSVRPLPAAPPPGVTALEHLPYDTPRDRPSASGF